MKKHLAFLLLCISTAVYGRQLTPQEAINRLSRSTSRACVQARNSSAYQLSYTEQDDTQAYYYVMNVEGEQGFYVLSADDCAPAVLGYSDSGRFSYDEAPSQLKWWLSQYAQAIRAAIQHEATPSFDSFVQHEAIAPLITTKWGQSAPYNTLCTDNGYTAPSGCVATAMAQIMHYYRWPVTGKSARSYVDESSGRKVTIKSTFSEHTYNWDAMLDQYSDTSAVESCDAVALLMKDCGVSVDMSYGRYGSGANGYAVVRAMSTYFGYSPNAQNASRCYYTDAQWEQLVLSELEQGRPLLYTGDTMKDEGHAFICDGYAGDGYYHINWGWDGLGDGNYLLTGVGALRPTEQGVGGGSLGYGFTEGQSIITGLRIAEEGEKSNNTAALGMPEGYSLSVESNELAISGALWNHSASSAPSFTMLGLALVGEDKTEVLEFGTFSQSLPAGYGYSNITLSVEMFKKAPGNYEVYPVYSSTRESVKDRFGNTKYVYSNWKEFLFPPYYTHGYISFDGTELTILAQPTVDETPIINIHPDAQPASSGITYDLQGRQVAQPVRPGLYIRDGRKVLVK